MKNNKKKKIGILGGSFDPAHKGHIKISIEAKKQFKIDKIIWAITRKNPFKSKVFINIQHNIVPDIAPNPKFNFKPPPATTNLSFSFIRIIIELSAVGLGFYLGGIVGIGTILYALGIGFSVSLGLFLVGKFYN